MVRPALLCSCEHQVSIARSVRRPAFSRQVGTCSAPPARSYATPSHVLASARLLLRALLRPATLDCFELCRQFGSRPPIARMTTLSVFRAQARPARGAVVARAQKQHVSVPQRLAAASLAAVLSAGAVTDAALAGEFDVRTLTCRAAGPTRCLTGTPASCARAGDVAAGAMPCARSVVHCHGPGLSFWPAFCSGPQHAQRTSKLSVMLSLRICFH